MNWLFLISELVLLILRKEVIRKKMLNSKDMIEKIQLFRMKCDIHSDISDTSILASMTVSMISS